MCIASFFYMLGFTGDFVNFWIFTKKSAIFKKPLIFFVKFSLLPTKKMPFFLANIPVWAPSSCPGRWCDSTANTGLSWGAGTHPPDVPDQRAALQIHAILVRIRIHGSIPLTNGSRLEPVLDADPAISVNDLQDVNKIFFLLSFFAYYFLKVHLHHFSTIKSHTEVAKQ